MSQRPGEPIRWRRNPPLTTASLDSAPLLALILVADFAITSLHSYQEWKGAGAPLWRNFGAIAGLDVPDRWGFRLFTVLLTLILFVIGFVGIARPDHCTGFLLQPCFARSAQFTLVLKKAKADGAHIGGGVSAKLQFVGSANLPHLELCTTNDWQPKGFPWFSVVVPPFWPPR
jgi:hypothetical protein